MPHKIPRVSLSDGVKIPVIGLGTYQLKGNDGVKAIVSAINSGYRLIDTAYNYENEGTVGQAIKEVAFSREELFITSKLPGRYHSFNQAITAVEESLYRAGLDYYDLYLIHWPNPRQGQYIEAWKALIEVKEKGLVRSIGVCNFLSEHIIQLEKETNIKPSLNQIEVHPYFNQSDQLKWNSENGIQVQSWSPIGRKNGSLLNEGIIHISSSYKKTPAQIVLRWHYQLGAITIPKSTSPKRQLENLSIFDFRLTDHEMELISSLSLPNGRNKNQDPAIYEEF